MFFADSYFNIFVKIHVFSSLVRISIMIIRSKQNKIIVVKQSKLGYNL